LFIAPGDITPNDQQGTDCGVPGMRGGSRYSEEGCAEEKEKPIGFNLIFFLFLSASWRFNIDLPFSAV